MSIRVLSPRRVTLRAALRPAQGIDAAHPLNKGLLAWWLTSLPSIRSNAWFDLAGRSHGTRIAMAPGRLATPPRLGWSPGLFFDGTDDLVSVPHAPALNPVSDFTIAAWIYPLSTVGAKGVVRKMDDVAGTGYRLILRDGGAIWADIGTGNVSSGVQGSLVTYTAGQWQHIVVQRKNNLILVYKNGQFMVSASTSTAAIDTTVALEIGRNGTEYFSGGLDDIRLWARALSSRDVWDVYRQSLTDVSPLLREPGQRWWVSSSGQTLIVTPTQLAWQAATPGLMRTLPVTNPSTQAWQAATARGGRALAVSRAAWAMQASTLGLTRGVAVSPARQASQAATRALTLLTRPAALASLAPSAVITRTGTVVPSQWALSAATRALTIAVRRVALATQAAASALGRTLPAQSSRLAMQASVATLGRVLSVRSAEQAWQTPSATLVVGQLRLPATRMALAATTALLGRVIITTPGRVALQAATRALTCLAQPGRLAWQAPSGTVVAGVTVFTVLPARSALTAPTSLLTRALTGIPAQEASQAPILRLGRTLSPQPSRVAQQTTGAVLGGTLATVPSRTAFQAATRALTLLGRPSLLGWQGAVGRPGAGTTLVSVTPGRLAWAAAQVATQTRTAIASRMAWQAAPAALTRSVRVVQAQGAWQTTAPLQTRTLLTLPGVLTWQAPRSTLGWVFRASASLWAMQGTTATVPRTVFVTGGRLAWRAATATVLAGSTVCTVTPGRVAWQAATRALTSLARPGRMAFSSSTGMHGRTLAVAPSRMAWRAATSTLTRSQVATVTALAWQSTTALQSRRLAVVTAQIAWGAATGILGRTISSRVTQQAWQVGRSTLGRGILAVATQTALPATTPRHTRTQRVSPSAYRLSATVAVLGGGSVTTTTTILPATLAWQVALAEAALRPTIIHRHRPVVLGVEMQHSAFMAQINTRSSPQTMGIQTRAQTVALASD